MSMIAEGYYATKNAYELIEKNNSEFKIISSAFEILYNNKNQKNNKRT